MLIIHKHQLIVGKHEAAIGSNSYHLAFYFEVTFSFLEKGNPKSNVNAYTIISARNTSSLGSLAFGIAKYLDIVTMPIYAFNIGCT